MANEEYQPNSDGHSQNPSGPVRAPSAVNLSRANRTLDIVWSNDHLSQLRLDDLRSACDCAFCRSEREKADKKKIESPRMLPVLGAATRADIVSISHVGLYALGIGWKDDHQSIFTYEYLLKLCPCDECTQRRDRASPAPDA
jgi:DUF971 family protein